MQIEEFRIPIEDLSVLSDFPCAPEIFFSDLLSKPTRKRRQEQSCVGRYDEQDD
jgi:hypothetical protein